MSDDAMVAVDRQLDLLVNQHILSLGCLYSMVGVVALSVECRTCDQEVVGSTLGRARGVKTLGKFLTPTCLCSPNSISWYRLKGSDALQLGSKADTVCVWVAGKTV